MSKQQKNTERYLAKKQMLITRKDDCNRSIRDLGVLPEEAFEKYTSEKIDKVRISAFHPFKFFDILLFTTPIAREEAALS